MLGGIKMNKKETLKEIEYELVSGDDSGNLVSSNHYLRAIAIGIKHLVEKSK